MKFEPFKKNTRFDKVVRFLNYLAVTGLVLCYLGAFINPDRLPLLAVWNLTYPFLLFTNLLFVLYWCIRSPAMALASALAILLGFKFLLANYKLPAKAPGEKTADNIRILSYNVSGFTEFDGVTATHSKVLNLLNRKQPDIFCAQEFTLAKADTGKILHTVKGALQAADTHFKSYIVTAYDTTGLAIFSRYPVIANGEVAEAQTQAIFVDIKYNGKILRVYNIHLQSTHFEAEQHQCIHDIVHFKSIDWKQVGIIYQKIKYAFVKRGGQANSIKNHMNACPYPYLVTGDCNDTPTSYVVNKLNRGLKNGFTEKGGGVGTTYYRDFPPLQIDYILSSPQFNFVDFKNIREKISDHYPVMADVKLQ